MTDGDPEVPRPRGRSAWGVHAARRSVSGKVSVGPTEALWSSEAKALRDAYESSKDEEVLGASVTVYGVDAHTHTRVALFKDGVRQQLPYVTDDREYVLG